jgi:hypothetical protein
VNIEIRMFLAGRVPSQFAHEVARYTVSYMFYRCGYHHWPVWLQGFIARKLIFSKFREAIEHAANSVISTQGFVIYQPTNGAIHSPSEN